VRELLGLLLRAEIGLSVGRFLPEPKRHLDRGGQASVGIANDQGASQFFHPIAPKSTDALHADIKAAGVWGEENGDPPAPDLQLAGLHRQCQVATVLA